MPFSQDTQKPFDATGRVTIHPVTSLGTGHTEEIETSTSVLLPTIQYHRQPLFAGVCGVPPILRSPALSCLISGTRGTGCSTSGSAKQGSAGASPRRKRGLEGWFEFFAMVAAAGIEPASADPGDSLKPWKTRDSRDAG